MKHLNRNKNRFVEYFLLLLTLFSLIITYIIGELYFYTPNGTADYVVYEKYLSFFNINLNTPNRTRLNLLLFSILYFLFKK